MELSSEKALDKSIETDKAGKIQKAASPIDGQNPLRSNVLDSLKLDQAIRLAKKIAKAGSAEESKHIYSDILARFPKNKRALDGIKSLSGGFIGKASKVKEPSQAQQQHLINLYQHGQLQLALDNSKQLLVQFPHSLILYNIQGAINAMLGNFNAAIDSYKQALKIKPDYADAYNNMGAALQDKGDLVAAIGSYRQAIKFKTDYAEAYCNMGIALKNKGDLEAAIDSFKQALKIKPDYTDAHYNIGAALDERGDLEAAIDSYKQALKINPNFAKAYYNIGSLLQKKGDPELAIDSYKLALKAKPDYAEAYNNMGNALRNKGDVVAAIVSFKKALKIKPDYANAYNNMGNALQDGGDVEAAISSYQEALKINPNYAKAYNNMAVLLENNGHAKAAIENYQEALKIKPDYAEAHYNMGNALKEKGDLEAAIGSYKKALEIKPDYEGAWYNLLFPLQAMKLKIPNTEELLSTMNLKAHSMYSQISQSVLNFSLFLGGGNAERALDEVSSLLSKADNIIIRNPKVTTRKPLPQAFGPNKTVALVHFGRSGTGLLHSLIDGHPEVSTMPSIYFSEFFNYSTWDTIISGGWGKMVDRFVTIYEVLFDATAQNPIESKSRKLVANLGQKEGMANLGGQQDEVLRVDKALFRLELKRLMDLHDCLDASIFFKLVHMAYEKALKVHKLKNLIFYHIHNPDNYAKLNFVQSVPGANWVMMVREPIQTCESWVRNSFHNNEYADISTKIITMLFEIDNVIYFKQKAVGVRLEDLKESPQKTIPALCDWLGIKETESLYEMTAQGKKWWGDPGSPDFKKDGMEPFGKTSIERKLGSIFTENDQFILRTLFYPFSVRFGYAEQNVEQFKADLKAIRPMLDKMFDFEVRMAQRMCKDAEQFMKSGYYLYLRSGLIDRWNMLAKCHTYPNMIKPLQINQ